MIYYENGSPETTLSANDLKKGVFEARDKTRFYKISRGSAYESMSQILVADAENYISNETCENLILKYKEVIDELSALILSLEK